MGISKMISKFDIKVIGKISKEKQIIISDNVATKITSEFNFMNYEQIYAKLMASKMYIAIMPEGMAESIYSYEEDILFINDKEELNNISKELLYECIHAMQEIRNQKGNIKQLGQCMVSDYKIHTMSLNEAAILYITQRIFKEEIEYIEAYGIKAKTYSPNNYPLICNILLQLLFILNKEILVKSTLNSTNEFLIKVVEEIGEGSYANIRSNLEEMLYTSEEIIGIKRSLKNNTSDGDIEEINKQLNRIHEKETIIGRLYMDSQMSIFTMYFNNVFNRIKTITDIQKYREKLQEYKELIGVYTNKNQEYFLEYYDGYCKEKEQKLIQKEKEIKRRNDLALTVISNNIISQIFTKIKKAIVKILKKV